MYLCNRYSVHGVYWSLTSFLLAQEEVEEIVLLCNRSFALSLSLLSWISLRLKVFRTRVRSILEYTMQVWHDIPDYLSDRIESVQKRAFTIVYPNSSYGQALLLANETTLSNRRELVCHKFMAEMKGTHDHPLSCLVSTAAQRTNPYNLRPGSSRPFNKFMRTRRPENFFTFKFLLFKHQSWLSFK